MGRAENLGIFTLYHNVKLNSDRKCNRRLGREKNQCKLEAIGLLEDEWRFEMDLKLLDRKRGVQSALYGRGHHFYLSIKISKIEIT